MSHPDDDITRDLRRELHGTLVPYDPALAQHMIAEAVSASSRHRLLHSRWTMPLLASGAVAAVVGGVAGAAALQPSAKPVHPGGGPTVTTPTRVVPPRPATTSTPTSVAPSPPSVAGPPPTCVVSSAPGTPPRASTTPTTPSRGGPATTAPPECTTVILPMPTETSTPPRIPGATVAIPPATSAPVGPPLASLTPMPGKG
ncbi:MAG TPA: hypothetical protein VE074_00190 [Jatrophihabitantaceae bacterium]|nr:hypothetical protein [Jatrophihabitantaceae bacterium]